MRKPQDDGIQLITGEFPNFESFLDYAVRWDLEFYQMDVGHTSIWLKAIDSDVVQLANCFWERRYLHKGSVIPNYHAFLFMDDNAPYTFRQKVLEDSLVMKLPLNGDSDALFPTLAHTCHISIEDGFYTHILEEMQLCSLKKHEGDLLRLTPEERQLIKRETQRLFDIGKENPDMLFTAYFRMQLLSFAAVFLHILNRSLEVMPPLTLTGVQANARVERFLGALDQLDYDQMPDVSALCGVAAMGRRSLEYYFRAKYHTSPKDFMLKFRLNKVRKALLSQSQGKTVIRELAHRWGFWHLGHFNTHYKKLFLETPTETLRRGS